MKTCTRCKCVKSIDNFSKRSSSKDGLNSSCKECIANYTKKYRSKNAELLKYKKEKWSKEKSHEISLRKKRWYFNNRERQKNSKEKWRLENIKSVSEYNSAYAKLNPEKINSNAAKRRAQKLRATPLWIDDELKFLIDEIYSLSLLRTRITGVKWNVDHIVPLQSKLVCGLHVPINLQVITAKENIVKHNRYWPNMP